MQYSFRSMRRRLIAAVWITGATVPLLMATILLVGCCVLPFHAVMHKLVPLCEMAVNVMRMPSPAAGHDHDPSAPASERQQPVKRLVPVLTGSIQLARATRVSNDAAPTAATSYRSFISLGAIRCDRDVGLHVVDQTFLI